MNTNTFDKFLKYISNIEFTMSMAALMAAIGINGVEITLRFLFGNSFVWIQDITLLLMVWMVFTGFTKVVYERRDIVVSIAIDYLPEKYRIILNILTNILIMIFYIILTKACYQLIIRQYSRFTTTIRLPMSYYTLAVFQNCIIVSLIYINEVLQLINKKGRYK